MGGWVVFQVQKLVGMAVLAVAMIAGCLAGIYAGLILVQQAFTWLKTGAWPPMPISGWLWDSVASLHIAVLMFAIAVTCLFVAGVGRTILDDAEDRIYRLRSQRRPPTTDSTGRRKV